MSMILHFLIVAAGIGFLIFIHEFGHFLVAKLCGVRVEKFSLGFGPPITGFRRGDTDYVISWIPLGGFVKMAGENPGDPSFGAPDEFTSKPVWQRSAIALAGISMNAVTALAAFVLAFKLGVQVIVPVVGGVQVGSPAWEKGIREGDEILKVAGAPVRSFEDLTEEIALAKGGSLPILLRRRGPDGTSMEMTVEVPRERGGDGIPKIGISPAPSLVIQQVGRSPSFPTPAQKAELQPGDRILSVGGEAVSSWREMERRLSRRAGKSTTLEIQRGGERREVAVTPEGLWSLGLEPGARVLVGVVVEGSPAARAGLRKDDQVVSVDGVPVKTSEGFQRMIQAAGDHPLTLMVHREDGPRSLQAVPEWDPQEERRLLGVLLRAEPDHAVLADNLPMDRPAHAVGLRGGDAIEGVDLGAPGTLPVARWSDLESALEKAGAEITLHVRRRGELLKPRLPARPTPQALGLEHAILAGAVAPGSPAEAMGLAPGDRLRYLRLARLPAGSDPSLGAGVSTWEEMGRLAQIAGRTGIPLLLDWVHDAPGLTAQVDHHQSALAPVPAEPLFAAALPARESLGVEPELQQLRLQLPGVLLPCREGLRRTQAEAVKIFRTVSRFFARKDESLSPKVLGGVITIFMGADHFLSQGMGAFVLFLGVISVNLAVLNLLPVPVLDGGLLLFLAIEKVRGAPLGEKATAAMQYAGLALVLSLVVFVTYNDIARLLSR